MIIMIYMRNRSGISPIVGVLILIVVTLITGYVVVNFGTSIWKGEKKINVMLDVQAYENKIVIKHLGGDPITMAFDPSDWWNFYWKFRRPITIENDENVEIELTNYQVGIFIPYDSDMNPDFSDLRFVDEDGYELPYWIMKKVDGEWAYVWVKVPKIPANGKTTIYVYYGNPSAKDESDPSKFSFKFYDDFSSDPTSRWNVYRYAKDPNTEFYWDGDVVYLTKAVNHKGSFAFVKNPNFDVSNGFVAEFDFKCGGGTGADGIAFGFYKNEEPYKTAGGCSDGGSLALMNSLWQRSEGYAVEFDSYNNSGTDPSSAHIAIINTYTDPDPGANGAKHYYKYYTSAVEDGHWHHVKIVVDPNLDLIRVYLDGEKIIDETVPFDISTKFTGIGIGGATGGLNNNHVIDNFILRPYIAEPECKIGDEEIRPTSQPVTTWRFEVPIKITERSGNNLYDYQVSMTVKYNKNMKPDFSDLRFIDENGNELSYWIETKKDGDYAYVWVKVPFIPANGNTTIYMLYGNPSAESKSNPKETMLIYEDMSTPPSGGLVGSAYYDADNGWVRLTEAKNGQKGMIVYNLNPGIGFCARFDFWAGGGTGADAVWLGVYDVDYDPDRISEDTVIGGYHFTFDEYQDRIAFTKSTIGNGPSIAEYKVTNIDNGQWHHAKICFYNYRAKIWYDYSDEPVVNATDTGDRQSLNGNFVIFGGRTGGLTNEHRIKNIIMRKYVDPEPTINYDPNHPEILPTFFSDEWLNLVVKLNGKRIGSDIEEDPKYKVVMIKLNKEVIQPGKVYDFQPGDTLEIILADKLQHGDWIRVIYRPTNQILAEVKI